MVLQQRKNIDNDPKEMSAKNVYGWVTSYTLHEMVYHIFLEKVHPLVVIIHPRDMEEVQGTLKHLCDVIVIKPSDNQNIIKKAISKVEESGTLILLTVTSISHFQPLYTIPTVLLSKDIMINKNIHSSRAFTSSTFICSLSHSTESVKYQNIYHMSKSLIATVQSRVAVAKKLYMCSKSSNSSNTENNNVDKITALKQRLRVLLNQSGPVVTDSAKNSNTNGSQAIVVSTESHQSKESQKSTRAKMILMNMITDSSDAGIKKLSSHISKGRSLALTRWMDGRHGSYYGTNWGEYRQGASSDVISRNARDNVICCRNFISECKKLLRISTSNIVDEWEIYDSVTNDTAHTTVSQMKVACQSCRVTAINWNPNPYAGSSFINSAMSACCDDDNGSESVKEEDWGGEYGKCCGHNEVAMHFMRPFYPMEVVNTTICSKVTPAPGNAGFHGCLEFLQSQCRWKRKAMTVWDMDAFHFINKNGIHESYPKSKLLTLSLPVLRIVYDNLKYFTINTHGRKSTKHLITEIVFLLECGVGINSFQYLLERNTNRKSVLVIQEKICSYLLKGNSSEWGNAVSSLKTIL
jgi:hypothetical protein